MKCKNMRIISYFCSEFLITIKKSKQFYAEENSISGVVIVNDFVNSYGTSYNFWYQW